MYHFLIVLSIAATVGLQAWRTLFDNFSVHVVGLQGDQIGVIQSVREIPGFLALLVIFVMMIVREHRVSSLSIVVLGLGVGATGFFPSYFGLIGTTVVMSLGFHYFETTAQSLTLQYFNKRTAPLVFGKLRSFAAASNIGVGALIFLLVPVLTYKQIYIVIGALILSAAVWSFTKEPIRRGLPPQRIKVIVRTRYWLYYFLTLMAGARRQIFVAFAVFLLVKKFGYTVQEITVLFVVNNVVNYFLSPLIGKAIVRFGERKVLSGEYASLIVIFLAYAMVDSKWIVAVLYVLDHIFFNFSMAIRTFFQKIGDPGDIAPSMAAGFTINHIGAVVFPVVGGVLWMVDYRIPFIAGAAMSLISLVAVQLITSQVRKARLRQEALDEAAAVIPGRQ
jgi:hypothetical protein